VHAAVEHALRHPGETTAAPTVVVLTAPDELRLTWLAADLEAARHAVTRFHEPDLDGALTSIACIPAGGRPAGLRRLPLLHRAHGKEVRR
jgi:hypothetical protein